MFLDEARIASRSTTPTSSPCSTWSSTGTRSSSCRSTCTASRSTSCFKRARRSERGDPASHRVAVVAAACSPASTRRTRRGTSSARRSGSCTATSRRRTCWWASTDLPPPRLRRGEGDVVRPRDARGQLQGQARVHRRRSSSGGAVPRATDLYARRRALVETWLSAASTPGATTSKSSRRSRAETSLRCRRRSRKWGFRATTNAPSSSEPSSPSSCAHSRRAQDRQSSAAEMLDSLVQRCPAATSLEVASWVKDLGADYLERRQQVLSSIEERWHSLSKMAAAFSLDGSPASGVQAVAPAPRAGTSGLTIPRGAVIAPLELAPSIDAWPELRRRLPAWMGTAALLLVSGISLGLGTAIVLGVRRPPEPESSLRGAEPTTMAIPLATALAPPAPPLATIEIAEPPPPATLATPVRPNHPWPSSRIPSSTCIDRRRARRRPLSAKHPAARPPRQRRYRRRARRPPRSTAIRPSISRARRRSSRPDASRTPSRTTLQRSRSCPLPIPEALRSVCWRRLAFLARLSCR